VYTLYISVSCGIRTLYFALEWPKTLCFLDDALLCSKQIMQAFITCLDTQKLFPPFDKCDALRRQMKGWTLCIGLLNSIVLTSQWLDAKRSLWNGAYVYILPSDLSRLLGARSAIIRKPCIFKFVAFRLYSPRHHSWVLLSFCSYIFLTVHMLFNNLWFNIWRRCDPHFKAIFILYISLLPLAAIHLQTNFAYGSLPCWLL